MLKQENILNFQARQIKYLKRQKQGFKVIKNKGMKNQQKISIQLDKILPERYVTSDIFHLRTQSQDSNQEILSHNICPLSPKSKKIHPQKNLNLQPISIQNTPDLKTKAQIEQNRNKSNPTTERKNNNLSHQNIVLDSVNTSDLCISIDAKDQSIQHQQELNNNKKQQQQTHNNQSPLQNHSITEQQQLQQQQQIQNNNRDEFGVILEKNTSFISRSPPVKKIAKRPISPRITQPFQPQCYDNYPPLQLQSDTISLYEKNSTLPSINSKSQPTSISNSPKLKGTLRTEGCDPVIQNKNMTFEDQIFNQKLTSRPLGRQNIYLHKAMSMIPQDQFVQDPQTYEYNKIKGYLCRDSRYFQQLNQFIDTKKRIQQQQDEILAQTKQSENFKQILNDKIQGKSPQQQYKQLLTQSSKDDDPLSQYSHTLLTSQDQNLNYYQSTNLAQNQHITKNQDWDSLQLANVLQLNKKEIVKAPQTPKKNLSDTQSSLMTSKSKKPATIFKKLVNNIKAQKDQQERPAWGASTKIEKSLAQKVADNKKLYGQLFIPESTEKKRKSYYQKLQEKKENQFKSGGFQTLGLQKQETLQVQNSIFAEEERPEKMKKRKSHFIRLKEQKEKSGKFTPLLKFSGGTNLKEIQAKVEYEKPPTPEYKRKSYYIKQQEEKKKNLPLDWNNKKADPKILIKN